MNEISTHMGIESLPTVLRGEPVIQGTRIAVRHVADLVKQGEPPEAIAKDLDLTLAQVEMALAFDRTSPRSGRDAGDTKADRARVPSSR